MSVVEAKFKKGERVEHFRKSDGLRRRGVIVGVHTDDAVNGLFYTIRLDEAFGGHELQANESKLSRPSEATQENLEEDWSIPDNLLEKYKTVFFSIQVNGFVPVASSTAFFLKSGLPEHDIGHLLEMSDVDKDGFLSMNEFISAFHIAVGVAKKGKSMPTILPSNLESFCTKATPPLEHADDQVTPQSNAMHTAHTASDRTMHTPQLQQHQNQSQQLYQQSENALTVSWDLSEERLQQYKMQFHRIAQNGLIGTEPGLEFFAKSGLSRDNIISLFRMVDWDKDGSLSEMEFCVAFHIAVCVKKGNPMPHCLPSALALYAPSPYPPTGLETPNHQVQQQSNEMLFDSTETPNHQVQQQSNEMLFDSTSPHPPTGLETPNHQVQQQSNEMLFDSTSQEPMHLIAPSESKSQTTSIPFIGGGEEIQEHVQMEEGDDLFTPVQALEEENHSLESNDPFAELQPAQQQQQNREQRELQTFNSDVEVEWKAPQNSSFPLDPSKLADLYSVAQGSESTHPSSADGLFSSESTHPSSADGLFSSEKKSDFHGDSLTQDHSQQHENGKEDEEEEDWGEFEDAGADAFTAQERQDSHNGRGEQLTGEVQGEENEEEHEREDWGDFEDGFDCAETEQTQQEAVNPTGEVFLSKDTDPNQSVELPSEKEGEVDENAVSEVIQSLVQQGKLWDALCELRRKGPHGGAGNEKDGEEMAASVDDVRALIGGLDILEIKECANTVLQGLEDDCTSISSRILDLPSKEDAIAELQPIYERLRTVHAQMVFVHDLSCKENLKAVFSRWNALLEEIVEQLSVANGLVQTLQMFQKEEERDAAENVLASKAFSKYIDGVLELCYVGKLISSVAEFGLCKQVDPGICALLDSTETGVGSFCRALQEMGFGADTGRAAGCQEWLAESWGRLCREHSEDQDKRWRKVCSLTCVPLEGQESVPFSGSVYVVQAINLWLNKISSSI